MSIKINDQESRKNLNRAIQDYRKNRERLVQIQTATKNSFDIIKNILKPTTPDLLECINVDYLNIVASNLGASEDHQPITDSGSSDKFFSKTIYDKHVDDAKVEIGNPAIAVLGQVKSGKSTFVNVLLRKNVVCQAYERCTARITRMTYCFKNYVEIVDRNGNVLERHKLKNTTIPKKFLQLDEKDRNNPLETGKQIRAGIKSEFLEYGIDLIDSPGLSENETLNNLSKDMIKSILPVIIYIIDGRGSVKQTDILDILELKNNLPNLQILYFITKLDTDDLSESGNSDPIKLAELKMEIAFKKLQFNNLIPNTFKHWSECPYFHGASLYALMDFYKNKRTRESLYHYNQFGKFETSLFNFLLQNFENKIYDSCNILINFHNDVLTKIINRAKIFSTFSKDYLSQIIYIKKMEEELFENIIRVITTSKVDLIKRLAKRLEDETSAILDPIAFIEYQPSLNIPVNGIVSNKKVVEKCQSIIMYALCQGLENIIRQFVEEELFVKYRSAIESQIKTKIKDTIQVHEKINTAYSSCKLCLDKIIIENYKCDSLATLSTSAGNSAIMKLMSGIFVSIKHFLSKLFKIDFNKMSVDVKSPAWKLEQAQNCLKKCNHLLLAEEICSGLINDFNEKHQKFLIALENEHKFILKKVMISEDIRMQVIEKAPDFAGLLMLTLDIKGRYMLQGVVEKEIIGEGAQGKVYRCVYNNIELAKKTTKVEVDCLNDIAEEIFYSFSFHHPRLLPFIAVSIEDSNLSDHREISIYSPLMKSDVLKYLKGNPTTLKERMIIGLQVLEALEYLHKQQIMHRDLKLANILLDKNNDVYLADYGFCKSMALTVYSYVGSPLHIAPEILRKEIYDYKIDIYSFGILLWYLAEGTGRNPKYAKLKNIVVSREMRPEKLDNIPDELWKLMELCWHNDSSVRPEIDDLMTTLKRILDELPSSSF